jgi:hypothetical protein
MSWRIIGVGAEDSFQAHWCGSPAMVGQPEFRKEPANSVRLNPRQVKAAPGVFAHHLSVIVQR